MKSANLRSLPVILLAAALGLASCKKPMTYVHVKILPASGGEPASITDVQLDLDLAGKKTTLHLTDGAAPIKFPTDLTLEIKTGSGQLALVAICRNASNAEVDRATGTVQVNSGSIAEVALQLPGGKPDLVPTEAQHDFTSVPAGQASPSINFTFHNVGFVASGAAAVALGGVGAAQFAIGVDGCTGVKVAPDGSCAVSVVFKPVTVGPIAATLTVSATPGGIAIVALTGTGSANPHTVTMTLTGGGGGSVASNETPTPKISCSYAAGAQSGTCSATYDYGSSVTLTATPDSASSFTGGSIVGAPPCTGNPCTFTVTTADVAASANFERNPPLTIATNGGNGSGTVSCTVNGGASGTCPAVPNFGDVVVITATADTGSNFTSWAGCDSTSTNQCTVTMTAPKTATATFTLQAFAVVVTGTGAVAGAGSGKVTGGGLNCVITNGVASGTCSTNVNYGSSITLTEAPAAGANAFVDWSGGCSGTSTTCTFSITATPPSTTANFSTEILTVTKAFDGTGTVTSNPAGISCGTACSAGYNFGTSVTLTATPASGSTLASWSGGGCSGTGTCTVTMTTAHSVTASFCGTNEVAFGGKCYYLDGSGGCCQNGFVRVSQSILSSIGPLFAGKNYKNTVSSACCIWNADTNENWGIANATTPNRCNQPGPFTATDVVLGGANCNNAALFLAGELTLCGTGVSNEVPSGGKCYYLDGSNSVCDPGYALGSQGVLATIAAQFVGKTYKHTVSNNCCIANLDGPENYGMGGMDCDSPGPWGTGPVLGGASCTNATLHNTQQLSLCKSP